MTSSANRFLAPILAVALSALTGCESCNREKAEPASDAAPQEAAPADTPAPPPPTMAVEVSPTPNTEATVTARNALCDEQIGVLAGGEASAERIEELHRLTREGFDFVVCNAVAKDAAGACARIYRGETTGIVPDTPYRACLEAWSVFHELRAHPKGHSYLFTDVGLQNCKTLDALKPHCDGMREALRSGDAGKCANLGELESVCRAFIALDKSLCQVPKTEGFFAQAGADIEKDCVHEIESKAVLAQGLEALAGSGNERLSRLAQAALGQSDACAPYRDAVMKHCAATTAMPREGMAPPEPQGTGGPATPAAQAAAPGTTPDAAAPGKEPATMPPTVAAPPKVVPIFPPRGWAADIGG